MARLHCSFCGKPEDAVERLVGGPRKVAICDECVALAADIVAETDFDFAGDMVLTNIGELVTNDPLVPGVAGLIPDAAIAVRKERVVWAGPERTLPISYRNLPELDCEGRAVIPGFVDAHTHLVFAGDRADEFSRRLEGESYEAILEAGGGINATVHATRATPSALLLEDAGERAGRMLRNGTTTVEVKSGYGLETATERRMLEVALGLDENSPIDVVPTFLGAHVVPGEYLGNRAGYVDLVIEEMLPACAPLAVYCDVFCENGAFSVREAERILKAARAHGLRPRLHANQLSDSGGAELAVELKAVSADHLDHVSDATMAQLAASGVVAVMLPGVSLSMRAAPPPAVRMWDAGVTVALATDCNPGTSYVDSMQLVVALAVLDAGLTAEQAIWSATRGGALALEEDDKGWIGRGALADFVVLDAPTFRHIAYRPGTNLAWRVVKNGTVVVTA